MATAAGRIRQSETAYRSRCRPPQARNRCPANGGKARSQGLEWTFGLTPTDGLKFALTGAYADAYLTENAPAAGASDGDRLPYAPKWSGSLDGSYTWRTFRDFNMSAGATWSCIGSRTSDFSATTEVVGGAVVAIPNPRAELPSYDTVNLRLGLDNPHWMFCARNSVVVRPSLEVNRCSLS